MGGTFLDSLSSIEGRFLTRAKVRKEEAALMPKSHAAKTSCHSHPFVDFRFVDTIYQIDVRRRKVYRNFVEVETSRASQIMAGFHSDPKKT